MSRTVLLAVIVVAVIGLLLFLSTRVKEQPTRQIEVAVPVAGNGN